jgi:hypothetical protein
MVSYNIRRPHQGRSMNGRTQAKAFRDSIPGYSKKEGQDRPENRRLILQPDAATVR